MYLLCLMMAVHFVADFILQSREMGKNKSTKFLVLLEHISIQFVAFMFCLIPFIGLKLAFTFALSNAIIHGIIDWNIWRVYKLYIYNTYIAPMLDAQVINFVDHYKMTEKEAKKVIIQQESEHFAYWNDHMFYTTIGLDQLLHTLTIITLYAFFV